jgi:hypothetical protein
VAHAVVPHRPLLLLRGYTVNGGGACWQLGHERMMFVDAEMLQHTRWLASGRARVFGVLSLLHFKCIA